MKSSTQRTPCAVVVVADDVVLWKEEEMPETFLENQLENADR